MRIGIDFDNTIACYNGAFHAAADQILSNVVVSRHDATNAQPMIRPSRSLQSAFGCARP